ncbi:hypothetical protein GQX74_005841 [Glossina fuscipes]|nr:hypothetical protein GQX74_005841 [Glossina fuscipes]
MSAFNFVDLAKELTENSNEEGLSFEDLQKNWSDADVKDVVSALETQEVMHYLKLNGNTLGVAGAAAIEKALEKHPEFYKPLWKDMFTGRLKAEIPEALQPTITLQNIRIIYFIEKRNGFFLTSS